MSLKRFFIVFLVISALATGGYFSYQFLFAKKTDAWSAIPETAVCVLELEDANFLSSTKIAKQEKLFHNNEGINSLTVIIDKINAELKSKFSSGLGSYFSNTSLSLSFHNIGNDTLNLLAVIPIKASQGGKLKELKSTFEQSLNFSLKVSTYKGTDILEFKEKTTQKRFFIYNSNNLLLISSSRDLLINACQELASGKHLLMAQKKEYLKFEMKMEKALFYINYPNLIRYTYSLYPKEHMMAVGHIADHAFFDVKIKNDEIFLHGFSITQEETPSYLGAFGGQSPGKFEISNILPERTAKLNYFYVSDYAAFHDKLNHYYSNFHPGEYLEHYNSEALEFHYEELYHIVAPQIALASVKNDINTIDRFFYLKVKDVEAGVNLLTNQEELVENYNDQKIYKSKITQLPELLLGDIFSPWSDNYFIVLGDYLVFGESQQSIMQLINDLDAGHNWNNAIGKNISIDEAFLSHNLGIYLNPSLLLATETTGLSDKAKDRVKELKSTLEKIDLVSLQFSEEANKSYTTLLIKLQPSINDIGSAYFNQDSTALVTNASEENTAKLLFEQSFESSLTSKPFVVKNHQDKAFYVLVQDSLNKLHFVNRNGQIVWSKKLNSPICSQIHQVDLFKNKKIQYLFATKAGIQCLDRKGKNVEGFPVKFKGEEVLSLDLFDYENNRDYRFAVSTNRNRIYLCNKKGKKLDGWNPKNIHGQLASGVKHFRVGTKDFIVAVEEQGIVHLFNRRGDYMRKFPFELKQNIVSEIFIDISTNKSKSGVIALTEQGRVLSIGLDADVSYVSQLEKGSALALFQDPNNTAFALSNGDSYFNEKGELVFNFDTKQAKDFRLYDLQNKKVVSFSDDDQKELFLYHANGQLILKSIPSDQQIGLLYSSVRKQYLIYAVSGNKLYKYKFEEK